jgi:hypothetical protein
MSRDISVSLTNSLDDGVVYPFFAVDLDFSSGPLYVWSGYGDLTIGSKTYLGAGQLLSISLVEESTEIEAKGASITMSGVPSDFLSLALAEPYQGRECRIYFGMTNSPSDYAEVFSGELDQMNVSEESSTATISITVENVLIKLERPVVRRFTDQDQRSRFPNDKGLEFVVSLQDKEIFWGKVAK